MTRHRTLSLILTLTLLLVSPAGPARAATPPDAEPVSPETVQGIPGATTDWWTAVQEDIRQSEYHVTWQERTYLADVAAAYQAPNRAHNLRAYFTPQGVRLIPCVFEGDTAPWEWGLTLTGYGHADAMQPVARRPLLRNLAPGLTPEEETWLLALVALELYYDAIRHRSRLRP